jgi:hypothetical protein
MDKVKKNISLTRGRVRPVRGPKKADTPANKSGRTSRTSVATGGKKNIATYGQAAAASAPSSAAAKGKADKAVKKVPPGTAKKEEKNANEKVYNL